MWREGEGKPHWPAKTPVFAGILSANADVG
jgi:hypothetical protein